MRTFVRILLWAFVLLAVLAIPLTSMASTDTGDDEVAVSEEAPASTTEEVVGAAAILAAIHVLAQPLVKIVDRLKKWFRVESGDIVTLMAVVTGTGLAWVLSLDPFPAIASLVPEGLSIRDFPAVVGYLVAGFWMAMRAGYLNDEQEALALS